MPDRRRRSSGGRPKAGGRPAASALLSLQRGLTGDRALAGAGYMDDPDYLAAYLEYYRAVSMAQVGRIADLAGLAPRSVLDLGAGPGSVSLELLGRGAREFFLVDSSRAALDAAAASIRELAGRLGAPVGVETLVADLESPEAVPAGRRFDLAAFGHCLNELGKGDDRLARRRAVVERAARALAPGGAVMALEPATLAASRDALALRDALVADGWSVAAPCTLDGPCPALAAGPNHTCHDESAWEVPPGVGRLAAAAGLDRDLIKMTWYVGSPPASRVSASPRPSTIAAGRGSPDPVGGVADRAPGAYRVVSAPMLNKGGRVRYLLCGPAGRFPFSARRDDAAALRAGFFELGRYDLVAVDDPEPRENGWGFGPATRIRRLSPGQSRG